MNAKIVIASTLKPVIDPRAYEKIGKSLADTGKYEVSVIGSYPTSNQNIKGISLIPFKYHRSNIALRLLLPWKILTILRQINPEILIITTHELLLVGVIFKILYHRKIIYDIQENYYYNILYQTNHLWGLRNFLAFYVRAKELLFSRFIDHYLLAEKCYVEEIRFVDKRYTVIENKYKPSDLPLNKINQNKIAFLLSGTISREYGLFDALNFIKQFNDKECKLVVIGHCPNKKTFHQLSEASKHLNNIEINVSSHPIPQAEIFSKIGTKTIALLPYQINKSTVNKIPTKLYEYIGLEIPVMITPNSIWAELVEKHASGLMFDFTAPAQKVDKGRIFKLSNNIYSSDLKDIMWNFEEDKLINLIKTMIMSNS